MEWRYIYRPMLILAGCTLVGIGFALCIVEVSLRVFDPAGIYARQVDLRIFYNHMRPDDAGYRFPEGVLDGYLYDATIQEDGSRYTPHTPLSADCTIAGIGDSFTFGYSVNDDDVWLSHLARALPDVQFINVGRPSYAAWEIARLPEMYPADGYLYLHYEDDNRQFNWRSAMLAAWVEPYRPALFYYVEAVRRGQTSLPVPDDTRYSAAIDTLVKRGDVLFIAFDTDALLSRLPDDVVVIPWHNSPVSTADIHADAAGNARMASDMQPFIADFIERVCDA